jgi:hypothetical protein
LTYTWENRSFANFTGVKGLILNKLYLAAVTAAAVLFSTSTTSLAVTETGEISESERVPAKNKKNKSGAGLQTGRKTKNDTGSLNSTKEGTDNNHSPQSSETGTGAGKATGPAGNTAGSAAGSTAGSVAGSPDGTHGAAAPGAGAGATGAGATSSGREQSGNGTTGARTSGGVAASTSGSTGGNTDAAAGTAKAAKPVPARFTVHHPILPLPGGLDTTPFFSCNSPEIVLESGVLLSTFPKEGMKHPDAHLDHAMSGRFDVFFHHVTNATKTGTKRTLCLGMVMANASKEKVHVKLLQAISYATKPDAPFRELPTVLDNEKGTIYAGPGDRVMLDMLKGRKQMDCQDEFTLNPGEMRVIYSLPMPVKNLKNPLNGRTGMIRIQTDGPVHLASLSAFTKKFFFWENRPDIKVWKEVLEAQPLVHPRDKVPTEPGARGALVYGRVAGIARGSSWHGTITNDAANTKMSLKPDEMFSYAMNTLIGGTFGTNQVQAAPMTVRYFDTAYQSHGNYGLLYDLNIPLANETDAPLVAGISFQSPIKDWGKGDSLQFFPLPPESVVFRGTVSFDWTDEAKKHHQQFTHLVEKRGQNVQPLIEFALKPHSTQDVHFKYLYPADCTPPHVLTVTTVKQKP